MNLLVRLNVGGSSVVSMTFKNEGIELPTAFYEKNRKHTSQSAQNYILVINLWVENSQISINSINMTGLKTR